MSEFTDETLIEAIKQGGSARQRAIQHIYRNGNMRDKVVYFVKQNSGNEQDGQDMFHEGIIVMDRNIRQGKFRGESKLSLYLYSICRFQWMNQLRKQAKVDLKSDHNVMDEVAPENPEQDYVSEERKSLLQKVLGQLNKRCQRILEMWKLSYSMEEIANELGLSSAAMARKNRYRCHQSLIKLLQDHPQWADLIR